MDRQRAEVSEKNLFWIEKHRYLELRQFCLQYPTWQKAKAALIARSGNPGSIAKTSGTSESPVEQIFETITPHNESGSRGTRPAASAHPQDIHTGK